MNENELRFSVLCDDALAALRKNEKEHVEELAEARKVWIKNMATEQAKLQAAISANPLDDDKAVLKPIRELAGNPPVDNRDQYKKYIGSFEAAKRAGQDKVSMDADEYDRLFNDNWAWRVLSKASNMAYIASRR